MRLIYGLQMVALATVFSVNAFAGRLTMDANDTRDLPSCGGTLISSVSDNNDGEQVNLNFKAIELCSSIEMMNTKKGVVESYRLNKVKGRQAFEGSITLKKSLLNQGLNEIKIRVSSLSGKHSDLVTLLFRVQANPSTTHAQVGDVIRLPSCEGTVEIRTSTNGLWGDEQVNLVFRNIRKCSNFDIVSVDGDKIAYRAKKLQGTPGEYSGSFTIPNRLINWGLSDIKVVVKSNSGKTSDSVVISVLSLPFFRSLLQ